MKRISEWLKVHQEGRMTGRTEEKEKAEFDREALFLAQKQQIMAELASATSQEEFEDKLKRMKGKGKSTVNDAESEKSSTHYLQENEDNCYGIFVP